MEIGAHTGLYDRVEPRFTFYCRDSENQAVLHEAA